VSLLAAAPARADATAQDRADALFEHARALVKQGRFAEACAGFQESQRIDPGIGTMLYLADCLEKSGRTASAWVEFLDAARAARAAGQADRERKARERAAALQPKLHWLSIAVPPAADVPGIEVTLDGVAVDKPLWGTALPVDPGEHTVAASAPESRSWSTKAIVQPADATAASVAVPVLERGPPLRLVGGVVLGVGLAGVVVGGVLGGLALQKKNLAEPSCYPNGVCNDDGRAARQAALGLATGSTAALIAGGAVAVAGVVLLVVGRAPARAERQALRIGPFAGPASGGLSIEGRL
jgi:serine/threonine-protein kinase